MSASIFSVFGEAGKPATKEHMIDELRKDHSNERYQCPEGMKLVEIDFANELVDGDMRGLQVSDKKEDKVLIARY
jgi:hypothetical protein